MYFRLLYENPVIRKTKQSVASFTHMIDLNYFYCSRFFLKKQFLALYSETKDTYKISTDWVSNERKRKTNNKHSSLVQTHNISINGTNIKCKPYGSLEKNRFLKYNDKKEFSSEVKGKHEKEEKNNNPPEDAKNVTNNEEEIYNKGEKSKEEETNLRFEEMEYIDEDIRKSINTIFKYNYATPVQRMIYEKIIRKKKQNDLLVQAKTGSGKTIAYLLLSIQDIVKNKLLSVHTLIIVPTRELAYQIYNEAKVLLTYKPNIRVITLTGGVKRRDDYINLKRVQPDIVICTVGRLIDHFECTYLFNTLFQNLQMLIIDEADQLLSVGYLNEINTIVSYLPKKRRNILFSATLSYNIEEIRKALCGKDYIFLNCCKDNTQITNEQLKQYVIFHKAIDTTVILYNLIMEHIRLNQFTYKIIVFFPTARSASFYATFFRSQFQISVYELHRKKEPAHRQIISNRFHLETVGILFTSDISSRGVDYPNVSLIIQVNCPTSREQYIHRVGRTARQNKKGTSIILLNEADQTFFDHIKDMKIQKLNTHEYTLKNANIAQSLASWSSNTQLLYLSYSFYSSLLRFYKTKYIFLKITDDELIEVVNHILLSTGLVEQPSISTKLAATLNMLDNTKLKIRNHEVEDFLT